MTTRIRLGIGLLLTVVITSLVIAFLPAQTVSAYTAAQINNRRAEDKYEFANKTADTITMKIAGDVLTFKLKGCNSPGGLVNPGGNQCKYELQGTIPGRCEEGKLEPSGPADIGSTIIRRANIVINESQISNTPGAKLDGKLQFFRDTGGGNCVMTSDIQSAIQVNNPFGAELALTGEGEEEDDSCEGRDRIGMSWFWCPLLRWGDNAVTNMTGEIENMLDFSVNEIADEDKAKLMQVWSIIRNISSIVLVIFLLAMVISQAVAWGPFDAYTVKRLLPRLVIAIIFIQISWPLFAWTVDWANAAGRGLGELMYAPFGGPNEMTLSKIVGDANVGFFEGVLLLGAGILAAAFAIILLGSLAISAAVLLIIGYLVLVAREILIILLLMTVPLALTMWVLPGTAKYWKLWHETFSKLLLMFPFIIALIAGGRIFAFAAANGAFKEASMFGDFKIYVGDIGEIGFFELIVIFVGFFGPFFILPKTFQWGGRALGALTGLVNDRSKGIGDKGKNFFRDLEQRKRGALGDKFYNSQARGMKRSTNLLARLGAGTMSKRKLDEITGEYTSDEAKRGAYRASQAGAYRARHGGYTIDKDTGEKIYDNNPVQAWADMVSRGNKSEKEAGITALIKAGEFGTLRDVLKSGDKNTKEAYRAHLGRTENRELYGAVYGSARDLVPQAIVRDQPLSLDEVVEGRPDLGLNPMSAQEILSSHHGFLQALADDPTASKAARQIIEPFVGLNPHAAASVIGTRGEAHLDKIMGGKYLTPAMEPVDTIDEAVEARKAADVKIGATLGTGDYQGTVKKAFREYSGQGAREITLPSPDDLKTPEVRAEYVQHMAAIPEVRATVAATVANLAPADPAQQAHVQAHVAEVRRIIDTAPTVPELQPAATLIRGEIDQQLNAEVERAVQAAVARGEPATRVNIERLNAQNRADVRRKELGI